MGDEIRLPVLMTYEEMLAAREACKNEAAMAKPNSFERKQWNGARRALERTLGEAGDSQKEEEG